MLLSRHAARRSLNELTLYAGKICLCCFGAKQLQIKDNYRGMLHYLRCFLRSANRYAYSAQGI